MELRNDDERICLYTRHPPGGGGGCSQTSSPTVFYPTVDVDPAGPSDFGPLRFDDVPARVLCLIVGGNWNNKLNAGVAAANANNAVSNSNDNVGARLAYTSQDI